MDLKSTAVIFCLALALGLPTSSVIAKPTLRSLDSEYANLRESLQQWRSLPEVRTNFLMEIPPELVGLTPDAFFATVKRVAQTGDPRYQGLLGLAYSTGWGTGKDKLEAATWLRKSAEKNWPPAQNELAGLLTTGEAGETNKPEALRLLLSAATRNFAPAQFSLGLCYHLGHGTNVDFQEARRLYELADRQNYAPATCNLANIYDNGLGVRQDHVRALELYRKAATQSFPMAFHAIGVAYARGEGVAQDFAEAAKWYHRAAVLGYVPSQHNLGNAYANGRGVPRDVREAERWLRQAAEAGIVESIAAHGLLIVAMPQLGSIRQTLDRLNMAADGGNAISQMLLALVHARLCPTNLWTYVPRDDAKAVRLARIPAEMGMAPAQCLLAVFYAEGRGVEKDQAEAYKWMTLAGQGSAGEPSGNAVLTELRMEISPRAMSEGLRRASQFRPRPSPNDQDGDSFLPKKKSLQ